ncbi:N-acetyltransferase [Flavobacterium alvei]|uniref:GNAT family N-acetyltransferase n=1 Tax=Flavobacterium alvei TaxID=2080416 RepID=UPI0026ECBA8F|nr:N-acetyltransferase [Flavobacterium alvei]
MESTINVTIEQTTNQTDFEYCALLMAKSDPWITLGMDFDLCVQAFAGVSKEVFIIKINTEIAGFVILQIDGTFKGYIQTICINENYRGKGLGKKLLTFCEERILKISPTIFICVSSFNAKALQLYIDFGFKIIGELPNFIKEGFTEILLWKTFGSKIGFSAPQK